jgi:hypothetical protein
MVVSVLSVDGSAATPAVVDMGVVTAQPTDLAKPADPVVVGGCDKCWTTEEG